MIGPRLSKVLTFDSGVGGMSIVRALVAARLPIEIAFVGDTAFFPYGGRADAEIVSRVPAVLVAAARETGADLAIVACNTASTVALAAARAALSIPVVGVVPAIKPAAALSRSGAIGLLATPRTIARPYVDDLVAEHAKGVRVLRHGPARLAAEAEAAAAGRTPDPSVIADAMAGLFEQEGGAAIDVVVLACTHYPLLRDALAAAAPPGVTFVDSGEAIARRVAHLLDLGPATADGPGARRGPAFDTGGATADFRAAAAAEGFAPIGALAIPGPLPEDAPP